MNRQNKLIFLICEIAYMLTLFVIIPSIFITTRPGPESLGHNQQLPLESNHPVSQTIISSNNGLNSISVYLKNPATLNRQNFSATLSDNGYILRQMNFNGYNVGDPSWLPFKFEPVVNSQNRQYIFTLSTQDPPINTISFFRNNNNGDITYKTTYKSISLVNSFKTNLDNQLKLLSQKSTFPTLVYIFVVIVLNLFILI